MQVDDRTKVNARIAGAFKAAADATGTSFDQLAATAARESDNRPDLAASTSSAKGLFQFVDQTWYELIKKEGPSVGLERLADQISSDGKGGYTVADPKEKARILGLKTDPLVASVMAGKFTAANTAQLTESLGRKPTEGEVYTAHVLGAAGATKLVRMAQTEPTATASIAFPKAAAANPALFYSKTGQPRTASELLGILAGTGSAQATQTRIADAYATLPTDKTAKVDPSALAAVLRAQAAAKVAGESLGATPDGLDRNAATRFARTALAQKSLPGASRDAAPPTGARVDGWRAKAPADAFSALMRSDGATLTADAATATGAVSPTEAAPEQSATPIRFASAGSLAPAHNGAVGGAIGGIPYVDPTAPMRLVADPTRTASAASIDGQPIGARPSRLMARAATGAPAMPLPMVDAGVGVVQSGRAATAAAAPAGDGETSGLVASGATRVKTVSIAPAPAAGTRRPLLPPVPGEGGETRLDTAAAATTARTPSRVGRPLDLLGLGTAR